MIWTIAVLRKSLDVNVLDLKFPPIPPNYNLANMENYDIQNNFASDKNWAEIQPEPEAEEGVIKSYTDFMLPYKAARCPNLKCHKVIPLSAFTAKKCPFCNSEIKEKPKAPVDLDKDKDGIDNESEKKYGLDPENYNDAFEDLDEDGFNNLCEHVMKTDLRDPKNYPPFALRLYVDSITKASLPVKLKKIVKKGNDKATWEIQIDQIINNKPKLKFCKIGDELEINKVKYKIVDIVEKTTKKKDKKLKTEVEEDISEVIIQAENDEPIVMVQNIFPKESKEKVVICDSPTGIKYTTALGKTFTIKAKGYDPISYTVISVDSKSEKKVVKLKNNGTGAEFDIDTTDKLKRDFDKREIVPEAVEPTELQNPPVMP